MSNYENEKKIFQENGITITNYRVIYNNSTEEIDLNTISLDNSWVKTGTPIINGIMKHRHLRDVSFLIWFTSLIVLFFNLLSGLIWIVISIGLYTQIEYYIELVGNNNNYCKQFCLTKNKKYANTIFQIIVDVILKKQITEEEINIKNLQSQVENLN